MRFKAAVLCKHAATDVAGERPLATVCLQVNLQVTGRLETLPAEPTAVRSVHCVLLLMRAEVGDGAEPPAAEDTRTRNGGGVRLEVFAQ